MNSLIENPFEHILYEFEMYIHTYDLLFNKHEYQDQFSKNLLVESHMLHLRILRYFFDYKYKKGFLARDFVNDAKGLLFGQDDLKDVLKYINNCGCHLSTERLKSDYKEKTSMVMYEAFPVIMNRIYTFICLLDHDIKEQYCMQWKNQNIQVRKDRIIQFYEMTFQQ